MGNSIASLQILRALAAWGVVYHHYMQMVHDTSYETWIGKMFRLHDAFGVDIFFVLSGFIMYHTMKKHSYSAKEFLIHRVIRIVPVYWSFTFVLVWLHDIASPVFNFTGLTTESLLASLLFFPHQNPSGLGIFPFLTVGWTLNFEMFFYSWLALSIFIFRNLWFPACLLTMVIFPLIWSPHWFYGEVLSSLLLYEFTLGMLLAFFYHRLSIYNYRKPAWLGIAVFVGALVLKSEMLDSVFPHLPYVWRFSSIWHSIFTSFFTNSMLAAGLIVTAAILIGQYIRNNIFSRAFIQLGNISYSTYLVHVPVIGIAVALFGIPSNALQETFLIVMVTVAVTIFSHYSYRYIETGPINNFLKHLWMKGTYSVSKR